MITQSSVGTNGANLLVDVRTVQFLLNNWREPKSLPAISVDGLFGPETLGAIRIFQQQETHIVDGRVDPNGLALKILVNNHERSILSYVHKNCKTILDNLDGQLRPLATSFPHELQAPMSVVRMRVDALRP